MTVLSVCMVYSIEDLPIILALWFSYCSVRNLNIYHESVTQIAFHYKPIYHRQVDLRRKETERETVNIKLMDFIVSTEVISPWLIYLRPRKWMSGLGLAYQGFFFLPLGREDDHSPPSQVKEWAEP